MAPLPVPIQNFDTHQELALEEYVQQLTEEFNGANFNQGMVGGAMNFFTSQGNSDTPMNRYMLYAGWVSGYPSAPGATTPTPWMLKIFGILTHQAAMWLAIVAVFVIILVIIALAVAWARKKKNKNGSEY